VTRLISLLILVLLLVGIKVFGTRLLNQQEGSQAGYVFDSFAMGTLLTIKVRGADAYFAEKAAKEALAEVRRLQRIFDVNDPESEISRLNAAKGSTKSLPLSRDMSLVLREALRICNLSGGLFEPAMGELVRLWGFDREQVKPQIPDSSIIKALVDSSSWSKEVRLSPDGNALVMGRRAGSLEMGGIAKGYAVDRAIAVLASQGVKNALVNLGGEIGVLGVGSNGRSWRIGVQHPRKASHHLGVIELVEGLFVATSGDYERYFISKGRRYHHILNPETGYPADRAVVSVTVVCSSCLEADALATAAFLMEPEEGIRFLERMNVKGLIVYAPDGDTESGNLAYLATGSFLELMKPELEGLPIP